MQKKQRIRWKLAHAKRKYTAGTTEYNDGIKAIGRTYNMSTGAGSPLRALAMHYQGAKYW
jgi:hypothetical protein